MALSYANSIHHTSTLSLSFHFSHKNTLPNSETTLSLSSKTY